MRLIHEGQAGLNCNVYAVGERTINTLFNKQMDNPNTSMDKLNKYVHL